MARRKAETVIIAHEFVGTREDADRVVDMWADALLRQWFQDMREMFHLEESDSSNAKDGN